MSCIQESQLKHFYKVGGLNSEKGKILNAKIGRCQGFEK